MLKSKPTTLGDLLCKVNKDAVTSLTLDRKNVRTESPRRTFGDEGMTVLIRLLWGHLQLPQSLMMDDSKTKDEHRHMMAV